MAFLRWVENWRNGQLERRAARHYAERLTQARIPLRGFIKGR